MKPSHMIAVAVTAGIVVAAASTAGCSNPGPGRAPSGTVTALVAVTAHAAGPVPTTVRQLCDAQTWPRPLPNIVGMLFNPTSKIIADAGGALACWDNIRGVAPDRHDPVNNPAHYDVDATYRITAVSPPPGTPIGRHDVVTVQLADTDPTAPPAFRPCDWVSASEAASALGGPVTAEPSGDQAGSVDMFCDYSTSNHSRTVYSGLQVRGAFPVDAASEFELETEANGTTVSGLGVKAACTSFQGSKGPEFTLYVLLNGDRLYTALGPTGESCDTLAQFARTAIPRINA